MLSSHFNMTTSECLLFGHFRCHVWSKSRTKMKEAWSRVTNSKLQSVTKPSTRINTWQVRTCRGNFCYFGFQLVILHQPIRAIFIWNQIQALWQHWNISLWQLELATWVFISNLLRALAALLMDCWKIGRKPWDLPVPVGGSSLKFFIVEGTEKPL